MGRNTELKTLIECTDSFIVYGEMIINNGEDSYIISISDKWGFVGVFDGCGGLGSRRYAKYDNKSGAYVSARITSSTMQKWFEEFCNSNRELSRNTVKKICDELKDTIVCRLKACELGVKSSSIKGSMIKSFPTTASAILFSLIKKDLYASYIWAGDSRGFLLTAAGLVQVTRDDVENDIDAFDNISSDSKLTNVISAAGDFILHSKIIECEKESVLITATDGCFAYFSTPMEFEYMLIDTLLKSSDIDGWKEKINCYIRKYTSDDYTIGIVAFGYKNFKEMKKIYDRRHIFLKKKYIKNLKKSDKEEIYHLWNEYKRNYYRGI